MRQEAEGKKCDNQLNQARQQKTTQWDVTTRCNSNTRQDATRHYKSRQRDMRGSNEEMQHNDATTKQSRCDEMRKGVRLNDEARPDKKRDDKTCCEDKTRQRNAAQCDMEMRWNNATE